MDHEQLDYRRVSPRLIPLRQINNAIGFGFFFLALLVPIVIVNAVNSTFFSMNSAAYLLYVLPVAVLVWGIVLACIIPRQVRAMGYLEQQDDLLLRRGILFRNQVAVPYGRIQYVDIRQGPLQRAFGVTQIVITTAGGGTASTFEGLVMPEAERLRDELTQRGYARLAELGQS
ncbi:PH domain-containing protein [Yaniella flava]|uniref:PH domain-containing protein n=1 Tax=Yaniella flava TaxID=287930 RepID=A0ABN2URN9_9MICC